MYVSVYWNLHREVFSVQFKGKVVKHCHSLIINEPKFVVRPAGREKVLQEKKKNVHAFVRGDVDYSYVDFSRMPLVRASYNPYKAGHFINAETGEPLYSAAKAYLTTDNGRPIIWAYLG